MAPNLTEPSLRAGPLLLGLDSHWVWGDGQPVHVTGKEHAILKLLVPRKGMVLTKEAFLNHLYGGMDEPEMKIIDVIIDSFEPVLVGPAWRGCAMVTTARAIGAGREGSDV